MALSYERKARIEFIMGRDARQAFLHAFRREFDPLRTFLDRIAQVDLWTAAATEPRDAAYLRDRAETDGFAPGLDGSPDRTAGRGKTAVNHQLHYVLRAALIRCARGTIAELPFSASPHTRASPTRCLCITRSASALFLRSTHLPNLCPLPPISANLPGVCGTGARPQSLSIDRLGALVKEAEVFNLRETLGDRNPKTLMAINNLAGLHMANGELTLANQLYRECLQARCQVLGHTHPTTLISMSNLGTLYSERGDYNAATPYAADASCKEGGGIQYHPNHHPTTCKSCCPLAARSP